MKKKIEIWFFLSFFLYSTIVLLRNGRCMSFGYGPSGALGYGSTENVGLTNETTPGAICGRGAFFFYEIFLSTIFFYFKMQ